ncbi:MAG: TolC family protein [Myxococcales bacterium]|jgi:outer membrane protein TolC
MSAPLLLLLIAATASEPAVPEPLARYLRAARENNLTVEIARAQLSQASAQRDQALGSLLPGLSLEAIYTRNQYESSVQSPGLRIIIGLRDSVVARAALNVPIFDLPSYSRYWASGHALEAAREAVDASLLDVELAVVEAYYQVVANQGLVAAARRAVEVAQESERLARVRFEAGTVTMLAVDTARVDRARAEQNLIAARRSLAVASRNLATLTRLPEPGELPEPVAPVPSELTEEAFVQRALERRAEIARQSALLRQATASRSEAWGPLVPTLSGFLRENYSNAAGFVGNEFFWEAGFRLDWRVDLSIIGAVRQVDAQIREQEARLQQTIDTVRDQVHTAWLDVRANLSRLEVARVEESSARDALEITRARYEAGTATSFELSQAQSDAFSADANLVQARADLAYSMLVLQKASGLSLLAEDGE